MVGELMNPTKPVSVADTLRAARALITPRGNWTKNEFARDAQSHRVRSTDADAVRWCSLGALERVDGSYQKEATNLLWEAIEGPIVTFNDAPKRKHAEVLAAFDKAIALAERKP